MLDRKYCKSDSVFYRQKYLCPEIQTIMAHFIQFALEIGVKEPLITETVTLLGEDQKVNRKHDQHRRRVAFDARVVDWSGEQIDAMLEHLNDVFEPLAYVTDSGAHQIAFCHDNGNGPHFHVAVNARFKLPEIGQF